MVWGKTALSLLRNTTIEVVAGVVEEIMDDVAFRRGREFPSYIPSHELRPLGASRSSKDIINEALKSQDEKTIAKTIYDVCEKENLNKAACVAAVKYCCMAVRKYAPQLISDACANIVYYN